LKRIFFKGGINLKNNNKTKDLYLVNEFNKILILLILPILLIIFALINDDLISISKGLYQIIIHPDVLITDYIEIGGLGAAFINSALLTLINILILWRLKIIINGYSISAIFIVAGFAFFGKNIFNIWPIYIGCYLYAKHQKKNFKNVAVIAMFGTALSPLVNEIAYGLKLSPSIGLPLGILVGILVGFILPPFV